MTIAPDLHTRRITTAGLDLFDHAEQAGRRVDAPAPQNPCKFPADPPPEALHIHDVLYRCIARRYALTAPRIAEETGLWPHTTPADRGTKVRELIAVWYEAMLVPGMVLVSDSCGYWHTADPEEISHYDRSLLSRIREIARRDRRLRMAAKAAGLVYHGHGHWSA